MATNRKAPISTLETERLWLRPVREEDAPRIQVLVDNINVVRYLSASFPWPYPPDGAETAVRQMIANMEVCEEYLWAIVPKGEEDAGIMGIISLTPDDNDAHRGFWLGEPYWGQGYMKEAVIAVTDFAFEVLEMEELILDNAVPNIASHRIKEHAGAEIVEITEADFVGGRFRKVTWRLTREAWRNRKTT